jgi:hypothetical protein
VINLKVKLGVQDAKMKKPGKRIAKKRTKGKVTVGTGQGTALFFQRDTFIFWAQLLAPNSDLGDLGLFKKLMKSSTVLN